VVDPRGGPNKEGPANMLGAESALFWDDASVVDAPKTADANAGCCDVEEPNNNGELPTGVCDTPCCVGDAAAPSFEADDPTKPEPGAKSDRDPACCDVEEANMLVEPPNDDAENDDADDPKGEEPKSDPDGACCCADDPDTQGPPNRLRDNPCCGVDDPNKPGDEEEKAAVEEPNIFPVPPNRDPELPCGAEEEEEEEEEAEAAPCLAADCPNGAVGLNEKRDPDDCFCTEDALNGFEVAANIDDDDVNDGDGPNMDMVQKAEKKIHPMFAVM